MIGLNEKIQTLLYQLGDELMQAGPQGQGSTLVLVPHQREDPITLMVNGTRIPDMIVLREFAATVTEAFAERNEVVTVRMAAAASG